MQEQNENDNEKKIDIKETLADFVKEDRPELSQIDAIKAYREINGKEVIYTKTNKKNDSEDETVEDDEHLKRVKKELIDSLARVEEMAKKIFDEKNREKENLKRVKMDKPGGGQSQGIKNQDKIFNQVKDKLQEKAERSREE